MRNGWVPKADKTSRGQKPRHCLQKPTYFARYCPENGAKVAKFAGFAAVSRNSCEEQITQYKTLAEDKGDGMG
jgi:hypothetical protein